MSSIKTELYFRQVLGRILRVDHNPDQPAWLFTFAEQNLIEFAERVERDIPESCVLKKFIDHYTINLDDHNISPFSFKGNHHKSKKKKSQLTWMCATKTVKNLSIKESYDEIG